MDEKKINGRVSDEDMALAVQKLLDEQKSLTERNLARLRERLTGIVTIINDNLNNIGAFSVSIIAKEGAVLVDYSDAEEPVTEAVTTSSSYHKGRSLLLAHVMEHEIQVLKRELMDRPSFPDLLAGILAGGLGESGESEGSDEPTVN